MEALETLAILIKYYDFGESDRLFVFFTRDFGKLKLIAKSARKSIKRQLTSIDLATQAEIKFTGDAEKELRHIVSVNLVEPFEKIRYDIRAVSVAAYFADLVDAFFQVNEKSERMFDELSGFLGALNVSGLNVSIIPISQMRLLTNAGFSPDLSSCVKCGQPLDAGKSGAIFFSNVKGGCVCGRCKQSEIRRISLGTVKMLRLALETPVEDIGRLRLTKSAAAESIAVLSDFIDYQLARRLRTFDYLEKLKIF